MGGNAFRLPEEAGSLRASFVTLPKWRGLSDSSVLPGGERGQKLWAGDSSSQSWGGAVCL